jgi:hypothetical protein
MPLLEFWIAEKFEFKSFSKSANCEELIFFLAK